MQPGSVSLISMNSLKLDYPNEFKGNYFRAYFMTEYDNGVSFIYSAFYPDDDAKKDNIGSPLMLIVKKDVGPETKFEGDLKEHIEYFWETEYEHSNDED
jgi:hypothetical protein